MSYPQFSFTPGGFVMTFPSGYICRERAPDDLWEKISHLCAQGEAILHIAVAEDGDWFLRTDRRACCKLWSDPTKSRVHSFVSWARSYNLPVTLGSIRYFVFSPYPEECFALYSEGRGQVHGLYRDASTGKLGALKKALSENMRRGIECISIGPGDSWVVICSDGSITWRGLCEGLVRKLKPGADGRIKYIALSPKIRESYYVQFADGNSTYVVPATWIPPIKAGEASQVRSVTNDLQQLAHVKTAANDFMLATSFQAMGVISRMGDF